MKLGVIGEPCIDYIHKPGRETTKSLGGILYSVVSLAILSKNDAAVYPIMYLGSDEYVRIISFLTRFGNIKSDFIFRSAQPTRVVNLYYSPVTRNGVSSEGSENTFPGDRTETSTSPHPPLEFDNIKKALRHLDALLVNMVSGSDITLDTFKKIRNNFPGCIHIDLHNIMMRTEPDGSRIRQPVPEWLDWCTNSDSVQANETEFQVMTGTSSEDEIAEKIVGRNLFRPKALIITRGKSGATLFQLAAVGRNAFRPPGKAPTTINRTDVPAWENPSFKDSTGCGDVFASAFFYKNALTVTRNGVSSEGSESPDFISALKFAARIAGLKTALVGVEELCNLFRLQKSSKLS